MSHLIITTLVVLSVLIGSGRFDWSTMTNADSPEAHAAQQDPTLPAILAASAWTPEPPDVWHLGGSPLMAEDISPAASAEGNLQALSLDSERLIAIMDSEPPESLVARVMPPSRGGFRSLDHQPAPEPTPVPSPAGEEPEPADEPAPEPQAMEVRSYTVEEGDTLLALAGRFGITPETILWANDLGNGELLAIGQELVILPVSGVLHTVHEGETFNEIANSYGADAEELIEANGLEDADLLSEGQVLIVPGGMLMTDPIEGLPELPSEEVLAAAPRYTVEPGDTLLSIADAFGVMPSAIQVANDLMDPDLLQIGTELVIPGGQAGAPAPAPAPRPAAPAAQPVPVQPAPPAPAPQPQQTSAQEPPAEPAPPASHASEGQRVAAVAQQYLGYRYLWGGHSPSTGFDCSGYTWYVYKEAGYNIPLHDLWGQMNAGPRISRENLLPGDLVFFENTYKPGLSHSGLYLGDGRFINAETERTGVQIRSLSDPYWGPRYIGASRPWTDR